jgi:DNA-binding response OmpR family regulator
MRDERTTQATRRRLIRVANADGAMLGLLREWLGTAGYEVLAGRTGETTDGDKAMLVIVDVPFSRSSAAETLQRVRQAHPDEPILALSATFFSNIHCDGACARSLGVAGVLPKPVACDALLAAVDRFAVRNR